MKNKLSKSEIKQLNKLSWMMEIIKRHKKKSASKTKKSPA